MSFDRHHQARRQFARWTATQRERLLSTGLPLSYWSTYENWLCFLDEGFLPYQLDPSQFDIATLSTGELTELQALVQEERGRGREACSFR